MVRRLTRISPKGLLTRFLLLSAGLLASFCAAEILVRVSGAAPEVVYIEKWRMRLASNPKIGYEPIPYLDASGQSLQFYGYQGVSNSLGFRDQEREVVKKPGCMRILVLGDSIAAGLWIKDENDVFSVILEKNFFARGRCAEVINFGVLGYNTQQEVETLIDKGLQYKPDLVILAYCLNDRTRDDGNIYGFLLREEKESGKLNRLKTPPLVLKSALLRFLRYRVFSGISKQPEAANNDKIFSKDTVEEYFSVLSNIAEKQNFKVIVAMFPELQNIEKRDRAYLFLSEHEAIKALCDKNGFFYLDLLQPFRECKERYPDELIAFDRYHPRPLGSRCAADALEKFISENVE